MKISELSRQSDVSIATIKYYLREELLPAGEAVATNQAEYGDDHVRRLRLIRALVEVGEIPIVRVRAVLNAVDSPSVSLHDAFGSVMHSIGAAPGSIDDEAVSAAEAEVRTWLRRRKWTIEPLAPAPRALAELLVTMREFDMPTSMSDFDEAADAAVRSAEFEVGYARAMPDRASAVETMVIGTVVYERVLAEIRRLALEATSARLEKAERTRRR